MWYDSGDFQSRLVAIRGKIKDNWSLCEFYGNSEAEYMIAETIHAACLNLETHDNPFSFRGDGVFACSGGGLCNNRAAYKRLLADGMFVEESRLASDLKLPDDIEPDGDGNVTLIFPTEFLVAALARFFATGQAAV